MNKYIDAEKLIAKLRQQKHELELSIQSQGDYGQSCQIVAYDNILSLINSLQQEQQPECVRKDMVVDAIKLAYGKVSMNPFDCSDAFEELLKKIGYEIH